MRKAKELIGKDIVHQATGEWLATVQDLLLDPDARHKVHAVGKDAIIADTSDLKPIDQTQSKPNDQQRGQL
jgi:sporulation protein YlmC with PRC-barrel domain